ncbi:MAG: hypothetical protein KKA73_11820 [Chloroflexi bacterium]|nr:hypothetical protein [Chloroflexota bacterium]MBU1748367.1 hypothetical protein [Chloroflexota bacterium]
MTDLSGIDEAGWARVRRRTWALGLVGLAVGLSICGALGAGLAGCEIGV